MPLTIFSFWMKFLGVNISRTVEVTAHIPKIKFWAAVGVRHDLIAEVHVAQLLEPLEPNIEVKFNKKLWFFGSVEKIIKDVIEKIKPPIMELAITTVNNQMRDNIQKALEKFQGK